MALVILLIFVAVPAIEIGLFVEVGGRIGLWPTLAIVCLTAFIGSALLRYQGLSTLQRVRESLAENRLPVAELFDGLCILMAGALLLTPGFMTDVLGFLLFIPPVRALAARALAQAIARHADIYVATEGFPPEGPPGPSGGPIIDGDFEEVTPDHPGLGDGRDDGDGGPRRP